MHSKLFLPKISNSQRFFIYIYIILHIYIIHQSWWKFIVRDCQVTGTALMTVSLDVLKNQSILNFWDTLHMLYLVHIYLFI